MKSHIALLASFLICLSAAAEQSVLDKFVAPNDVTWSTLGTSENDSLPIGNGDIAVNVWTEQNGDLVLLVAKSDAWSEIGKLVKLGRVRIHLTPNPFAGAADFSQRLELRNGSFEIKSGASRIRVWVDANHPALHVEANLETPTTLEAGAELWRTNSRARLDHGGLFEYGGHFPELDLEPDKVLSAGANDVTWCHFNQASAYSFVMTPGHIVWCHFNQASAYSFVMQKEHLESLASKYPDPFLHRCFGATLIGPDLTSVDDHTLKSSAPAKNFQLVLYALTQENAASAESWKSELGSLARKTAALNPGKVWQEHELWWRDFWNRSWIHVEGT